LSPAPNSEVGKVYLVTRVFDGSLGGAILNFGPPPLRKVSSEGANVRRARVLRRWGVRSGWDGVSAHRFADWRLRASSPPWGPQPDIAAAYVIYQRTHSAYWLSALFLLTFGVNGLLSPFFGALADRYDRRRIMIASDLLGAACFALLIPIRDPAAMIALVFVASLAATPFRTASGAAIPNLAPEGELAWANSLLSMSGWTGRLTGFGVGGALVAIAGSGSVFAIDAVSFVFSAGLVVSVRLPFGLPRTGDEGGSPRAREGSRFVLADRALRAILLAWALMFLGVNITTVANVPLARDFHAGSFGYGMLESMYAGGSLIGAFIGRWIQESWLRRAIIGGTVAIAIGQALVGLSPWFLLILVAVLLSAIADSFGGVAGESWIQLRTPDEVRGRVMGALGATFMAANVVAFTIAGPLTTAVGAQGAYAVGGGAAAFACVVLVMGLRGTDLGTVRRRSMIDEGKDSK
jgi:MFS family permease